MLNITGCHDWAIVLQHQHMVVEVKVNHEDQLQLMVVQGGALKRELKSMPSICCVDGNGRYSMLRHNHNVPLERL